MNELAGGIRKRGVRINGHYHELSQLKGSLIDAFRKMIKKKNLSNTSLCGYEDPLGNIQS